MENTSFDQMLATTKSHLSAASPGRHLTIIPTMTHSEAKTQANNCQIPKPKTANNRAKVQTKNCGTAHYARSGVVGHTRTLACADGCATWMYPMQWVHHVWGLIHGDAVSCGQELGQTVEGHGQDCQAMLLLSHES